jgi:hypothetical protein
MESPRGEQPSERPYQLVGRKCIREGAELDVIAPMTHGSREAAPMSSGWTSCGSQQNSPIPGLKIQISCDLEQRPPDRGGKIAAGFGVIHS